MEFVWPVLNRIFENYQIDIIIHHIYWKTGLGLRINDDSGDFIYYYFIRILWLSVPFDHRR